MTSNARKQSRRVRRRRTIAATAGLGLTMALTGTGVAALADRQPAQENPEVFVATGEEIGPLSGQLTGANINVWFEGANGLWDTQKDEPNPDVVSKTKQAGLGMVRFPGGTEANLYDWKAGIGPTADRGCQARGNPDGAPGTDSDYGPDEFMEFVRETGTVPTIMTPMANETPADAADWVEYMNAEVGENPNGGKDWAKVREANKDDDEPAGPYDVQQWEIGNEPDRAGQNYWRSTSRETGLKQYTLGGRQDQVGESSKLGQRLANGCDRQLSASKSSHEPNQTFQVLYPPVVPKSQRVKVDGDPWTKVGDLSNAGPNDKVYEFDPTTGEVLFGDGQHGKIPAEGARLGANYTTGPMPGFLDFYQAMKKVDPSIDVCSTWAPIRDRNGDNAPTFAELMAERNHAADYDCVVIHPYTNFTADFEGDAWDGPREGHDEHMVGDRRTAAQVDALRADLKQHSTDDAYVAMSEFGALWFGGGDKDDAYPNWNTSMSHVTYMASQWARFAQRGIPWVMGNTLISESSKGLRGVLGGPDRFIFTAEAVARQQLDGVLDAAGTTVDSAVRENVSVPAVGNDTTYGALKSTASIGDDGVLRIFVVNRHPEKGIRADVVPDGFAYAGQVAVSTVAGKSFQSYNGPGQLDEVSIVESMKDVGSGGFEHTFPAASTTVLELSPTNG